MLLISYPSSQMQSELFALAARCIYFEQALQNDKYSVLIKIVFVGHLSTQVLLLMMELQELGQGLLEGNKNKYCRLNYCTYLFARLFIVQLQSIEISNLRLYLMLTFMLEKPKNLYIVSGISPETSQNIADEEQAILMLFPLNIKLEQKGLKMRQEIVIEDMLVLQEFVMLMPMESLPTLKALTLSQMYEEEVLCASLNPLRKAMAMEESQLLIKLFVFISCWVGKDSLKKSMQSSIVPILYEPTVRSYLRDDHTMHDTLTQFTYLFLNVRVRIELLEVTVRFHY